MSNGEATARTERTDRGAAAFTHLGSRVREALSDRGFTSPTEPQRRAIPPLAAGSDGLVIAPTGTGKTETAMLPVFDAIEGEDRFGIAALYITPLRALNRDMRDRLEWWGEQLDLDIDVRHGDTTQYQRGKQADDPPDVLVTTPETLQAMLTGEKLRRALADVSHVVIDEVHELAASKRGAQLTVGLERLSHLAGRFQRVGLSATVGDPAEVGRFLTGGRGCEIIEIDVGADFDVEVREPEIEASDERLASRLMTNADVASHVRAIREIVAANDSTLIFVNTRQTAEALGSRFKELELSIGVHHGSLSRDARIEVEDAFKTGELDALLCTSSMELGIDVGRIDHVIQYQSPREVARLLQRVGRAGHRSGRTSRGTILTTRPDDTLESLAIARRARAGEVESVGIHHGSLDTLANQIVGLVMDVGEIDARAAYEILTRAYPFRALEAEQFKAVARDLSSNRVLWLDEERDELSKSGGSWQYFYSNLSMIPDEQTYEVQDMASGRQVGTLDERFVVDFAQPGEVFIQRGEMWRITEIDEDRSRVQVNPIEDPAGEVPTWIGQEIPVPFAVAGEVGRIRGESAGRLASGTARESVATDLCGRYPTDEHTASEALVPLSRQVEASVPIPTDDRLVIEFRGETVLINACLGHKVNSTLGRLLSALLGQRTGSSIGLDVDPYRIELDVPRGLTGSDVREILETTDPAHVEAILELSLKNSDALKFKLAQVATKFGALEEGNRDRDRRFGRGRLLDALAGTPAYEEALREVFQEDLAIEGASAVLEGLQSDEIELETVGERTPIGLDGRSGGKELLAPENADASVIETVRERLQGDRVILLCVHCREWQRKKEIRRIPDRPECPNCGSTRIAALNPWAEEVVAAVRAGEKDDEQERQTRRAHRAANLVQSHGKQAVIALAARGVGPQTAARIIAKLRENEEDFYRDIIAQERQYARTKAFWD